MKTLFNFLIIATLCAALVIEPACSAATFAQEFSQYANEVVPALNAVLAILQFFNVSVPAGITAKVSADVSASETLVNDFASANAAAQPSIYAQIQSEEAVLNQDMQEVFVLARVNDKNSQQKVSALVSLMESAIQEAFALVPHNTTKVEMVKASAAAYSLSPNQCISAFNSILVAPTGNKALDKLTPTLKLKTPRTKIGELVHFVTFGVK